MERGSVESLNILFDHQVFASQKYGGVSRLFYESIKRLADDEDIKLRLFHGLYINRYPLKDFKNKAAFYFGKKMPCLPYIHVLLKPLNHFLFKMALYVDEIEKSARNTIHIYHPTGYSSFVSDWKKCPVVLTVNDMIPELFPENFRDIKSRLEMKRKCIERADKIIAISYTTKKDLINFYNLDENKISVIYPGAPSEMTVETPPIPYSHIKPYILYVGTRKQGYKNFDNLLIAYSTSKRVRDEFDLICFGGPPFSAYERDIMSMMNSLDNVYQTEGNDLQLARLYAGASAFIYPSLYEGFGLSPLEAMAYGCPVIASSAPVITEVLENAAIYFDPTNPESIANSMESILFDETLREEYIKKGRSQVKKYSWSHMTNEIVKIYKTLK